MTPCVKVNRVVSKNTNELKTRTPPISSLVGGDAVRRLMETKSERGRGRGLAYSVTCLTALRRGHAAPPNRREVVPPTETTAFHSFGVADQAQVEAGLTR